jgi:hypothetical protein
MLKRTSVVALVVLAAVTACNNGGSATGDYAPLSGIPTAVSCADSRELAEKAVADRKRSDASKSDQERIYVGNRASFFASLAIIADLKCRFVSPAADEALKPAFEAARKAEATRSTYEMAYRWGEADYIASQAIALLVQQIPAPTLR